MSTRIATASSIRPSIAVSAIISSSDSGVVEAVAPGGRYSRARAKLLDYPSVRATQTVRRLVNSRTPAAPSSRP